jgi:hypothetical protein
VRTSAADAEILGKRLSKRLVERARRQLVAHGAHDGVDIIQAGVAFGRERFLQALSGHSAFIGYGGKPFDTRNDAQGGEQDARIAFLSVFGEDFIDECIDLFRMSFKIFAADLIQTAVFTHRIGTSSNR